MQNCLTLVDRIADASTHIHIHLPFTHSIRTTPELAKAVERLCSAYQHDEHSPTVVTNKRDVRIITTYLAQLLTRSSQVQLSDSSSSASSSVSGSLPSLPDLPLDHSPAVAAADNASESGVAAAAERTRLSVSPVHTVVSGALVQHDDEDDGKAGPAPGNSCGSGSHTPIPLPPPSPFAAEPIIEKSSQTSPSKAAAAVPAKPAKPIRRRHKIRLSASEVELLEEKAAEGGTTAAAGASEAAQEEGRKAGSGAKAKIEDVFDDLWGVEASPKPSSGKATKHGGGGKKKLLAPAADEGKLIPDHELW